MNEHCDVNKPCPHNVAIAMLDKDLNGFGARTNTLVTQLSHLDKKTDDLNENARMLDNRTDALEVEISSLKLTVTNYTSQSSERHQDLKGYVVKLGDSLEKHMVKEERELKVQQLETHKYFEELLKPIQTGLSGLYDRWWGLSIYLIGSLAAAVVGLLVYLWQHMVTVG